MAIISSKKDNKHDDDCNCEENDTKTQKTITSERKMYCDELYTVAGEVSKYETKYAGQTVVYEKKKCLFLWTEDNYRRYRNTSICVGTELAQSNDIVKENVGNYVKWSTELSTGLKNIFKAIKEVKTKMGDLREAACKLDDCRNDSCNCTQLTILTGKEKCEGKSTISQENRPDECSDAEDVLEKLICMPKALRFDADYLFKASSDVIGIQVFSNIGALEPIQKVLSDHSKALEKQIQETMKLREADLKKVQEELVKVVQETTRSAGELYNKRSDYEGLMCTTKFLCCPKCGCVVEEGDCDARLEKCKEEICEICEEVNNTFCKEEESNSNNAKAS